MREIDGQLKELRAMSGVETKIHPLNASAWLQASLLSTDS